MGADTIFRSSFCSCLSDEPELIVLTGAREPVSRGPITLQKLRKRATGRAEAIVLSDCGECQYS
jgi:hypothetical protein